MGAQDKTHSWHRMTGCVICCCRLGRMHFGARSERLPEEQLQLGLEALEQAIAKEDAEAEKRDPERALDNAAKQRASRGALPAHLPRIEVTLTPEDTACPCCRASMTVIGEDSSERLDVIPAQFRVIVTRRPKLDWVAQWERNAGRGDGGLTTAEREELSRLRRENRQLRLEREILSKAAAWFARERTRSHRRVPVRE